MVNKKRARQRKARADRAEYIRIREEEEEATPDELLVGPKLSQAIIDARTEQAIQDLEIKQAKEAKDAYLKERFDQREQVIRDLKAKNKKSNKKEKTMIDVPRFKSVWKARFRKAKPYLIKGAIGAGVVAGIYVAARNGKREVLVALVGEAKELHLENNQLSMTPEQVRIKIRLLKNPATVLINAARTLQYALVGGELTSVAGDFTHVNPETVNKMHVLSWTGAVALPTKVYFTQVAERFRS